MNDIISLALAAALFCEAALIAMLVWSIFVPDRRLTHHTVGKVILHDSRVFEGARR
jgi:hypothetical protein